MIISTRPDIRNVAIIAHVDHGKTTLVDFLLRQAGTFKEHQALTDRVMDSNDLEKERGITILSKNASVTWNGIKINIVDTPGHSDFGGEVERVLSLVDGVLLLVDAAEGPLPQTRFVLKKALELKLKPIVVINKIDRADARAHEVLDEIYELFLTLGNDDDPDQLDFPVIYAIARQGIAKMSLDEESDSLTPIFETIIKTIPGPKYDADGGFQMSVAALDWSDYVGRISIGRIHRGTVKMGDSLTLIQQDGTTITQRISKLYTYEGLLKVETNEASAGDIVAIAGFEEVLIGSTLADSKNPEPLDFISIEEPTIAMNFIVNNSPFAGREGKFVTTPKLRERLFKELRTNVSLRVRDTELPDVFSVSARGELQLAILIETMRREGFEFSVSKPIVLMKKDENGEMLEPIEHVVVDVTEKHIGTVIELLGKRKGEMTSMVAVGDSVRAEFYVPARGLIGFRTEFLTLTRGEGIIHHTFFGYAPFKGAIAQRSKGALVAMETGQTTAYALESAQERGVLFIGPGIDVYEGMVVGENSRDQDLIVNPTKAKQLTNMRSSSSDGIVKLDTPRLMSLEQFLEFIADDELLEITPLNIRIRKKILNADERIKAKKKAALQAQL